MKAFDLSKIFITLVLFGSMICAQTKPLTNFDLVKECYDSLFLSFLQELPGRADPLSLVALEPSLDMNWIVKHQWIEQLEEMGFNKIISGNSKKNQYNTLFFRPVLQQVNYEKDGKYVERRICVECYVQCLDTLNQVLFSRFLVQSKRDRIRKKHINHVENPLIPMTHKSQITSKWQKFVEPLLISLVSGTIITIFYTYRSK